MLAVMANHEHPLIQGLRWILANRQQPNGRAMSMRSLSVAAGLTPSHVEQIINKRQKPESLETATILKLAQAGRVQLNWLLTGQEPRDIEGAESINDTSAPSPQAPPVSDTFVSDDRIDALLDTGYVQGQHSQADARLVRSVLHRRNNLLSDNTTPADYVRKLLDTAAKCREAGRKVSPDELYDMAFRIVADELAMTSRQLREARAILDAMEAEAQVKAKELGIELRTDTPHPALLAGIAAAKKKMERRQ